MARAAPRWRRPRGGRGGGDRIVGHRRRGRVRRGKRSPASRHTARPGRHHHRRLTATWARSTGSSSSTARRRRSPGSTRRASRSRSSPTRPASPGAFTGLTTSAGCTSTSRSTSPSTGRRSTCSSTARTTPTASSRPSPGRAMTVSHTRAWPGPPRPRSTSTSTASWVVGDRPEDMGLADAIGASRHLPRSGDPWTPRCLVVPESRGRRPLHLGARHHMSAIYDLPIAGAAPRLTPGQVPGRAVRGRHLTSRSTGRKWRGPGETVDPAAIEQRGRDPDRRLPVGAPGCSPAATAARRPSPTTCSATT